MITYTDEQRRTMLQAILEAYNARGYFLYPVLRKSRNEDIDLIDTTSVEQIEVGRTYRATRSNLSGFNGLEEILVNEIFIPFANLTVDISRFKVTRNGIKVREATPPMPLYAAFAAYQRGAQPTQTKPGRTLKFDYFEFISIVEKLPNLNTHSAMEG
jgi:hypothetical protein